MPFLNRSPEDVWLPVPFGRRGFYVVDADGGNQRQILENVTEQVSILYMGGNERIISWGR